MEIGEAWHVNLAPSIDGPDIQGKLWNRFYSGRTPVPEELSGSGTTGVVPKQVIYSGKGSYFEIGGLFRKPQLFRKTILGRSTSDVLHLLRA
jgi:hypothetical protein